MGTSSPTLLIPRSVPTAKKKTNKVLSSHRRERDRFPALVFGDNGGKGARNKSRNFLFFRKKSLDQMVLKGAEKKREKKIKSGGSLDHMVLKGAEKKEKKKHIFGRISRPDLFPFSSQVWYISNRPSLANIRALKDDRTLCFCKTFLFLQTQRSFLSFLRFHINTPPPCFVVKKNGCSVPTHCSSIPSKFCSTVHV